jgi:LmbE family N-acetylglucosaminyl deacetylase
MSTIFFSPHCDDESLFGAFLIMEHNADVVVVLGDSDLQEKRGLPITSVERRAETVAACEQLGVTQLTFWPQADSNPDWDAVERMMRDLPSPQVVIAPLPEVGGHEQHNHVGRLAKEVFGSNVIFYLTYTSDRGRSDWGDEVVPKPWMIPLKLRALSCYYSQILHDGTGTREWFTRGLDEHTA